MIKNVTGQFCVVRRVSEVQVDSVRNLNPCCSSRVGARPRPDRRGQACNVFKWGKSEKKKPGALDLSCLGRSNGQQPCFCVTAKVHQTAEKTSRRTEQDGRLNDGP